MSTNSKSAKNIRLFLSDVDGVMTDGSIMLDNVGNELKRYHVRDGAGIKYWQQAGHLFGVITGRRSWSVERRCEELGVSIVYQRVSDKWDIVEQLMEEFSVTSQEIAYIGDDLADLIVMNRVGFSVAVADACTEVQQAADYVTKLKGGQGAVRETIELILKEQGRWTSLIEKYSQVITSS